jgi:tetratricopeptide (TPR) repeat protein
MSDLPPTPNLDVPALLELSQPRARGGWFWYAPGIFMLVVLLSTFLRSSSGVMAQVMSVFSAMAMVGIIAALVMITMFAVRRVRAEQQQIEAAEELVQLRRWPEAATLLVGLLSRPTRTPQARVQALIYLSSVLGRYNRFEDAIAVQNHLLEHVRLDANTVHALRLGRAMAMLREDHLVDADRAIVELRRQVQRANVSTVANEVENASEPAVQSAGLALIEMYRDVKTGHPNEAVEIFERSLPALRDQLGHRAGDAYGLLAKSYDMLGRESDAQAAYEKATLLTSPVELDRRYPELRSLAGKYRAAARPAALEAAA